MRSHFLLLPIYLFSGILLFALASPPSRPHSVLPDRKTQVEADWLQQDTILLKQRQPLTPADDAAGACDGIKDGKWGFHTNHDNPPWWQVDIGEAQTLDRVLVYNRCDAAIRAARLILLLSEDGSAWREAYRHNGELFYGATDGKPLTVNLTGAKARFVRIQLPEASYLHLDEVEVYGSANPQQNLALGRPASQSSISQWSARHLVSGSKPVYLLEEIIERGRKLRDDLRQRGTPLPPAAATLEEAAEEAKALPDNAPLERQRDIYRKARWAVRKLALANPLLDFDRILFVKRSPGSFSHMSDQHYGWWSRPGGGLYILEGFKTDTPRVRPLTAQLPPGSCIDPDLSYDGKKVLFAYCRFYPHVAALPDKVNKNNLPEDAFYHLYEMNLDGTGLKRLTRGRYDDFSGRYLPNGEIAFLSTRRGQLVQTSAENAAKTDRETLPDGYVRCGGDPWRPVSVYTLHTMAADGSRLRSISSFESFEWTPSVAEDGRLLYARWDYVDRDNMPYMGLWAVQPDGTNPQAVYGNYTRSKHCVFEARSIPGSRKLIFTASAHHSITGGSLVLLDPARGMDGHEPLTRLTPEVCFPEIEGWPASYYANPFPLSERYYLTAWSNVPFFAQGGVNPPNAMGIYLLDAFGNLELLYRDPDISSMYPIPVRSRPVPPALSSAVAWDGTQEGKMLLLDVYQGLTGVERGAVKRLRLVGVPVKTQPNANLPGIGQTGDDPGKFVIGTVPVEPDGSAFFRVPSGVPFFCQALDKDGQAIQTMRSLTTLQPRQTLACAGCHEPRNTSPANVRPMAARRAPSRILAGPEGSWPLRFDRLVQPVLEKHCVPCHRPGSPHMNGAGARYDLTPARAYEGLLSYGGAGSLREHVRLRYREGRSKVNAGAAQTSALLRLLKEGHHQTHLDADSWNRLVTWMDTYAQVQGHYSEEQERSLQRLRERCADLMEPNTR
jgi:hypothetical protein